MYMLVEMGENIRGRNMIIKESTINKRKCNDVNYNVVTIMLLALNKTKPYGNFKKS